MIDITPGKSERSETYNKSSIFNNYLQTRTSNSIEAGDMDRTRIPAYNEFGNDDFGDPEGENIACLICNHTLNLLVFKNKIAKTLVIAVNS